MDPEQRRVLKTKLIKGVNRLSFPKGSKPVSAHEQAGNVTIWVLCPRVELKEDFIFYVCFTGETFAHIEPYEFLGTCFIGNLVYHVLYRKMPQS